MQIRADPKDKNRVYRLGVNFYVSDDMGKASVPSTPTCTLDYRSLWIDPDDNNHLIVGEDGGLGISWNRTATWMNLTNIPIGEYWELSVDTRDPYLVCGGLQDNGIWCIPSLVRNRNGISSRDAFSVGGGDGMYFQIDPRDTNYAFIEVNSSSTVNSIQRLSLANLQRQPARPGLMRPTTCLDPRTDVPLDRAFGKDPSYRWAWNTPIVFSSVTPGVVYAGSNMLFKSADRGGSWKPISPDLTARVDRDTIRIMGKPVGKVNYSPGGGPAANPLLSSLFGAITWISESPLDGRVIYTGADDGASSRHPRRWRDVDQRHEEHPWASADHVRHDGSAVALRRGPSVRDVRRHFNNDERTYVYASDDFGRTSRSITNGLPTTSVARIAEHPKSANDTIVNARNSPSVATSTSLKSVAPHPAHALRRSKNRAPHAEHSCATRCGSSPNTK